MSAKFLLGIDVGTYSTKGVILSDEGELIAQAQTEHELIIPEIGYAEHDPDNTWWGGLIQVCRALLSSTAARSAAPVAPGDIAGVGISGIAPCVLPVDADGNPLRNAILYGVDTRAAAQIRYLTDALGSEWIRNHSGADLDSQSAGPKVLWIRDNEPDVWSRSRTFMTCSTYLGYRLTGNAVIDHYTAAFYSPLYDLTTQSWNEEARAVICPGKELPALSWAYEVAGTVTATASEETGLAKGTPVIVGSADASAEAVGAGVAAPGESMLMIGSSVFIISWTSRRPGVSSFWTAPGLTSGRYAVAAGMATAGSITRWFRDQLGGTGPGAADYPQLMQEAATIAPGADGLLALPYFSGERTPIADPRARGVIAGVSLSHTRAHLYRALLEAVAFGIRHNLSLLERAGTPIHDLTAIGGGTRNPVWMQIISDVLQREIRFRSTAGASFGDALMTAVGTGVVASLDAAMHWIPESSTIRPMLENRKIYDDTYQDYLDLYTQTRDTIHKLVDRTGRRKP